MSIDPGYQKFIVPPPPLASNQEKAEVRVGMVISQLMDIRCDTGSGLYSFTNFASLARSEDTSKSSSYSP